MKCDRCDKPAVVHEVTMKQGMKKEVHLCEECAGAAGIALPAQPINQLLTQFVVSKSSRRSASPLSLRCPECNLSFKSVRKHCLLGCSTCYETFAPHLGSMIERAQDGGQGHVGKTPRRGGESLDRQLIIHRLVKELDTAVASEQYERAAELRDRLKDLAVDVSEASPEDGG